MFKKFSAGIALTLSFALQAQSLDFVHILEQGYWYSRYNLGHLVMRSGNGETFMPEPEMVKKVVGMVSDDLSQATPPVKPALLKRVYNSGTPHFINPANGNPADFSTLRWEASDAQDEKTSYEAFAWTVTKEVEWSKQFNVDSHFGSPDGIAVPGAQQRFAGVVLCVEAMMQTQEFMRNQEAFQTPSNKGLASALLALSNFSDYLKTPSTRNMQTNRCMKAVEMMAQKPASEVSDNIMMFAENLYEKLKAANLETVAEKSLAVQAYAWFGQANESKRSEVKKEVQGLGRELARVRTNDPLELAYAVRGLNDVARITGNPAFNRAFESTLSRYLAQFDESTGLFKGKDLYTTDDAAVMIGALNAGKLFSASEDKVTPVFIQFFDQVLNKAGMQLSAPPVETIPEYERKADTRMHRADELPMPRMIGNGHGIAPVYAASVEFDGEGFQVDNQTFDTAGGMHLANEMIWFHNAEVDGFPSF